MTPLELKQHRKALGLSQKALALRLGVSEQAIWMWENNKRPIPKLMDLAMQALKAEAADIIDKLVEALEMIAKPAAVSVDLTDGYEQMYNGWRDIAVTRIDVARATLSKLRGEQ